VILAPPLWATDAWAADVWADGTWATTITIPSEFGDLTTLFVAYCGDLRDANADDLCTLIRDDLATVIAGTNERADRNTQYAEYLS
jgi:hypothetical protein